MKLLFVFIIEINSAFAIIPLNEDSLFQALTAKKADTTSINLELSVAKNLENSDPEKAFMFSREAYKQAMLQEYSSGIARSLFAIARGYKATGDFDSSLFYARKGLELSTQLGDKHLITSGLVNIGVIYKSRGIYDSAVIYYHRALTIAEESNDIQTRANCLNNLGNVLKNLNNVDEAVNCFTQALALHRQQNDQRGVANTLLNLGICYDLKDESVVAERYFQDALKIFTAIGDKSGIAKCDNDIAKMLQYQGKFQQALPYMEDGLKIQREMNDKNGVLRTLYAMMTLYNDIGNNEKALEISKESLALAREMDSKEFILNNYSLLHDIHYALGNIKEADDYLLKAVDLKDSLFNDNKTRIINELQTKYETEKKEQEIKLLNEENKTKDLKSNLLIVAIVTLILVLGGVSYIYYQRQRIAGQDSLIQKQKIEDLMKQQEINVFNSIMAGQERERKRIAGDLHDRLGSLLATVKAYFSAIKPGLDPLHNREVDLYSKTYTLLDQTVSEVYQISNDLNTGVVNFGLEIAIKELCERITEGSDIECKVMAYNLDVPIDHETEIGIYRIVQELLSNILKHAKAKIVTVQLNRIDGALQVTVEDDGIGYNFQEKINSGRMGLKNMIARVEKLNGTFYVDSLVGNGSFTILKIPFTESEQILQA